MLPFFCNIPTSFRLQNSHAQFFLPLQAGSFPLWAWLFPYSGTFHFSGLFHPSFLFLCLPISFLWNPYLSSLALLFLYDILSFHDPFSSLFTVIVRTFLFRKLIKLVLPTLLLFCSCLQPFSVACGIALKSFLGASHFSHETLKCNWSRARVMVVTFN